MAGPADDVYNCATAASPQTLIRVRGMNEESIIAYWGAQDLKRWSEAALSDVAIPDTSKTFLREVGLPAPQRRISSYKFEWHDALARIADAPSRRLLGNNYGRPILIDESRDGCVIWGKIDDTWERYVNASVEQFAASLIEVDRFATRKLSYDDPATQRAVTALWRELKKIDPTAIADPESLWSLKIFDMRLEI